jgi:hypothetical protein
MERSAALGSFRYLSNRITPWCPFTLGNGQTPERAWALVELWGSLLARRDTERPGFGCVTMGDAASCEKWTLFWCISGPASGSSEPTNVVAHVQFLCSAK